MAIFCGKNLRIEFLNSDETWVDISSECVPLEIESVPRPRPTAIDLAEGHLGVVEAIRILKG